MKQEMVIKVKNNINGLKIHIKELDELKKQISRDRGPYSHRECGEMDLVIDRILECIDDLELEFMIR